MTEKRLRELEQLAKKANVPCQLAEACAEIRRLQRQVKRLHHELVSLVRQRQVPKARRKARAR